MPFNNTNTQTDLPTAVYDLMVGTPAKNCEPGADQPLVSTITGSITITNSWSVGTNVGLDFGALHIGGSFSWTHSQDISYSQSIQVTVVPGQMVCYGSLPQM